MRRAYFLHGILVAALLIFGGVADHALVEQVRATEEAALSGLDEKARMTAQSVRVHA